MRVRARHRREVRKADAKGVRLERRKNGGRFPVPRANHQRFVAEQVAWTAKWQQVARAEWRGVYVRANKKAGTRPAFSGCSACAEIVIATCYQNFRSVPVLAQYFAIIGPPQ